MPGFGLLRSVQKPSRELSLKVSDVDSKRMVIHVQGGKGRKDQSLKETTIYVHLADVI